MNDYLKTEGYEDYKQSELYKICCDFLVCDGLAYFKAMEENDSCKRLLHSRYFAEQNMAKSVLATLPDLTFSQACDIVNALDDKILDSLLLIAYCYTNADGDTFVTWAKTSKDARGYLDALTGGDKDVPYHMERIPWADRMSLYGADSALFKDAALKHGWKYGCYFCGEMQTMAGEPYILDDGTIICKECYDKRYKGADGDEIR